MNKNPFLVFPALMVGALLMIVVATSFSVNQVLPQKETLTAAINPPAKLPCPFEEGFTPFNITATSSLALKQESLLLKAFLDKVENCKEDYNLNTCLALFQEYCVSQGKCTTHYSFSQPATITPEIKNLLCEEWNKRYLLLYEASNWQYLTNLFNTKQVAIPSYLANNYNNYLSWKKSLNTTTTTTKITTTTLLRGTTTTTTASSTLTIDIESFKPKAKSYPVLSVSPDIDISQIVPAGYNYAPRIESWLYYLDSGMYGLTGTISYSAPPASSYLVLDTNSSRRYKVERIDTDGNFVNITNSPDTKWEVTMPVSLLTDQSCFHFILKDLSPEEMQQLENYELKPIQFRAQIEALRKKMVSPELQEFRNQDNNNLQEYLSQKYNIPLSSYLVPIGLPAWKDNTTQFIDGHYVGLCKQVNKNTEEYTGAMGWNNCIFSYYEKNNGIWRINSSALEKYKKAMIDNLNAGDPNGEYISSLQKKIINSVGIQEGFCLNSLTQEQQDTINSLQTEYQGLIKDSDSFNIPLSFNVNDYIEIANNGEIKTKNKEGMFFVTVTDNSYLPSLLERFKNRLKNGYKVRNPVTVTFPIVIIDFNRYNTIINDALVNINELSHHRGAAKYIKENYDNIPGLYGINYTCFSGNISQLMVKGIFLNEAISKDCPLGDRQVGAEIYSLFPDTIFISKEKFDSLDKGMEWFKKTSLFYPVQDIVNSIVRQATTEYFPIPNNFIETKLRVAVMSLQSVLYDAALNLYGRVSFSQSMKNSTINRTSLMIPCQYLANNSASQETFTVEGISLNNSNWRDTIRFKVFDCTNTLPKKEGINGNVEGNGGENNGGNDGEDNEGDNEEKVWCSYYRCQSGGCKNFPNTEDPKDLNLFCSTVREYVYPSELAACQAKSNCDPKNANECINNVKLCRYCTYEPDTKVCRVNKFASIRICNLDYQVGNMYGSRMFYVTDFDACKTIGECDIINKDVSE